MIRIYHHLLDLIDNGERAALATIVRASGSSPQNVGAQVLFLPNGQIVGTIGGGCLEAEARRVALDCLRTGESKLFDLRLDDDFGWDDGLICGGSVSILIDPNPSKHKQALREAVTASRNGDAAFLSFRLSGALGEFRLSRDGEGETPGTHVDADGAEWYVEPILPRPELLIAGCGHVGAALGQIASLCGFEVVMVDDRPAFASRERLPFADRVEVTEIAPFFRDYPLSDRSYVAIVTRGHRNDARVLKECLGRPSRYLGMIGSKRKIVVIFDELLREGLATPEQLRSVRSPMGLTIGDREVGEIAVSIMAEIVAVRNGADLSAIGPMQYLPPSVARAAEERAVALV
jgi:xanthine dehydrogenase accessory factor